MTFSLRIDVDVPYGYHSRSRRVLNRLLLDYRLPIRLEQLGYGSPSRDLLDYLDESSISAAWFFGTFSLPSKRRLTAFEKNGPICFHSERTRSFEEFQEEYDDWCRRAGRKPDALSKHGSGEQKLSKRHHPQYKPRQLLEFMNVLGIPILLGNDVNYLDRWEMHDDIFFIPSVFWIDYPPFYPPNHTLADVIAAAEIQDIIILLHPVWWILREDLRSKIDFLIRNHEFISLEQMLHKHSWI